MKNVNSTSEEDTVKYLWAWTVTELMKTVLSIKLNFSSIRTQTVRYLSIVKRETAINADTT